MNVVWVILEKIMNNYHTFNHLTLNITNPSELNPVTTDELRACEQKIGHKFEQGYVDFITRFGGGIFGGCYVRLYLPTTIVQNHFETIKRYQEYYFWDNGSDVLNKEQVLQSVCVGDTFSGDELIYVNGGYYILPREEDIIYAVGEKCSQAIEWQLVHNISNDPDEKTGNYGHCDEKGAYYFECCDF